MIDPNIDLNSETSLFDMVISLLFLDFREGSRFVFSSPMRSLMTCSVGVFCVMNINPRLCAHIFVLL